MSLKERSYGESVELVLSRVIIAYRMSGLSAWSRLAECCAGSNFADINLLLNPREMGELIKTAKDATLAFHKYSPKLGEL